MLSSKTKTGLSEAIPNKTTPATPRNGKLARTKSNSDSPSTPQTSRLSIDRSQRSVESKPPVERRSPRTTVTPDKQQTRTPPKGSELQAQLNQVQEELKKSKEQLASVEKEKEKALEELELAKKLAEEATDRFGEAVLKQKRAEETSEIEKFRAVELEQAGIEAVQKREDEWQKEIEAVRSQHAMDVSALLSTTEELQQLKQELAMTSDAKNQALSHADDATKIAEIHVEKVELLSAELSRVKVLLDSNQEMKNSESTELIKELNTEIGSLKEELEKVKVAETQKKEAETVIEQLKHELEKARAVETKMSEAETLIEELRRDLDRAKSSETQLEESKATIELLKQDLERAKGVETKIAEFELAIEELEQELKKARVAEKKLSETEILVEQLKKDVAISKKAETDAVNLVEEWRVKAEQSESRVLEANESERLASESVATFMEQLEEKSGLLQDTEAEAASLREKVESLEMSVGRYRKDLDESEEHLLTAKQEASEKAKMAESLISQLESIKEEKMQALDNEKLAASSIQSLLEEKNKLINELDVLRDEDDKSKKVMESLTSALHEASSEVREAKEKLLSTQTELENADAQIEDLKLVLKATNEKTEALNEDADHKIKLLTSSIEQSKLEYEISKSTWDQTELKFMNSLKESEEEASYLKKELDRLTTLLKEAEEEAKLAKKKGSELEDATKEAESEVVLLQEVVGEVKSENMILKDRLLDKENELQNLIQENEELRMKEANALEKVELLSKLHEESLSKESEENGDLSNSEKDYDMLPSVVEFSEENGVAREEPKPIVEIPSLTDKDLSISLVECLEPKLENGNGNGNYEQEGKDTTVEVVEAKMWESCKIGEKDLIPEKEAEPESLDGEADSKADEDSFELNGLSSTDTVENGATSPTKQQSHKKKKPLLHKFGSLLKKSSTKSK